MVSITLFATTISESKTKDKQSQHMYILYLRRCFKNCPGTMSLLNKLGPADMYSGNMYRLFKLYFGPQNGLGKNCWIVWIVNVNGQPAASFMFSDGTISNIPLIAWTIERPKRPFKTDSRKAVSKNVPFKTVKSVWYSANYF